MGVAAANAVVLVLAVTSSVALQPDGVIGPTRSVAASPAPPSDVPASPPPPPPSPAATAAPPPPRGSFDFPTGDDVWVIPVNGGRPRQLTHIAPDTHPQVSSCYGSGGTILKMETPVWSPDDRSIAFLSTHRYIQSFNPQYDVFTVSTTGGPVHLLRKTPAPACVANGGGAVGTRWLPSQQVALLGWI